jgi:branched-chain amino acid transport system ATP-binding protein
MTDTLLSVEDLSIRFGGLRALNAVNFEIKKGEIVGLIGPNGAGKTTLFSALVGLNRPQSGSIRFRGEEILGEKPHKIARRGMTKTFQNTALFPDMSLLDNVLTAALVNSPLAEARDLARDCLDRVGLIKAAEEDVENLTFPQRALGEVARGLATRPQLLLLDEVMAALTPVEMDSVIASLTEIQARDGVTFMVVEHHMHAIMKMSGRVLVLNFGELIAVGTPKEVSRNDDVIAAYLGDENA